jgi:hypothetical protein
LINLEQISTILQLLFSLCAETNKQVLLGSLRVDADTFAPVLSHSVLAPEVCSIYFLNKNISFTLGISRTILIFLPCREMKKGVQDLRRFSKIGQKKKPS